MRNWLKKKLPTVLVSLLFFIGIFYVFNIKAVLTSSKNIEFSPGDRVSEIPMEHVDEKPKNIIFFIADGMGFSHLSLAMLTQQEEGKPSVWDQFDIKGWHDPRASYGPLTDSGASATAMATGTTTFFEVIGMDAEGGELKNLFEVATDSLYNTGIVTDSYLWDATPAAFVAHTNSRDNSRDILTQFAASELDVLFGELEDLGEDGNPEFDETVDILNQRFQLLDASVKLPQVDSVLIPIAAIFDEDQVQDLNSTPNLTLLTDRALEYLSSQNDPFVLVVECEEMDSASHANASKRILRGIKSMQKTLEQILSFAEKDGETLVVFTSDHETGGLAVVSDANYPNVQMVWGTRSHSATVVPLFAKGPGAKYFADVKRNRDVGVIMKSLIQWR